MKKIYCFIEKEEEWKGFYEEHQSDMIYVYSSVIASCEDSLFYCFGEIFSVFMKEEEKCVLVTDVHKIYKLAKLLCTSLFEDIIFFDSGNTADFSGELQIKDLVEFELLSISDEEFRQLSTSYFRLFQKATILELVTLSDKLVEKFAIDFLKKNRDIIAHFCKVLIYLANQKDYVYSKEFLAFNFSMLMQVEQSAENTNQYLEYVLYHCDYTGDAFYFIWNQFKPLSLKKYISLDEKSYSYCDELYQRSYEWFYEKEKDKLCWLHNKERRKDRVLVLTIQLIDGNHAPSKTVKERVKSLIKMGKEVYLVNTMEYCTIQGYAPFYGTLLGNSTDAWENERSLDIEGEKVWYYQFSSQMPLLRRMDLLQKLLREIKPYYILAIGTGSMLADLCSHVVPCFSMALAFSTLPKAIHSMKILGRQMTAEEKEDTTYGNVIESRFTFELKPQTEHFSRADLGIPENAFVLAVIGIRLDAEVDKEFLEMLESVCVLGCHVVFAGRFDSYGFLCKKHEWLDKYSSFMGYCNDILALMEICDLYINPNRLGGGFSVIEAFSKGVPGVYLPTGDVYTAGGSLFAVEDYSEMLQKILQYKEDKRYYDEMSQRARERAKMMTSSIEALQELHNAICSKVEKEFD